MKRRNSSDPSAQAPPLFAAKVEARLRTVVQHDRERKRWRTLTAALAVVGVLGLALLVFAAAAVLLPMLIRLPGALGWHVDAMQQHAQWWAVDFGSRAGGAAGTAGLVLASLAVAVAFLPRLTRRFVRR